MMTIENAKFMKLLPAGEYFIGDLCYIVPNDYWNDLCDQWFDKTKDGVVAQYTQKDETLITVYAFSTAYGDGTYVGSDGFKYGVDAGLIGIMPVTSEVKYEGREGDLYTRVKFDKEFMIATNGETLVFGDIVIETGYEDEEDYSDPFVDDYDD